MRRLLILVAAGTLAATLVGAAGAARPIHQRETFSGSSVSAAGERCDFDYRVTFKLTFNDLVFGDLEAPDRLISHVTAFVSHTNLETGYTLTEVDRTVQLIDFPADKGKTVGIQWKLRTPEGKLVFVRVGQLRYTLEGEIVKITPHLLPEDVVPIVCGLLGGHAA
jgi:hypothetical protein